MDSILAEKVEDVLSEKVSESVDERYLSLSERKNHSFSLFISHTRQCSEGDVNRIHDYTCPEGGEKIIKETRNTPFLFVLSQQVCSINRVE